MPAQRSRTRTLGPGFNALFAGSLISNTGDGLRLAALPLLAAELTSSPLLISAVTAAQYLPWATVAPVGGVFVDRWNRRRTILVTQAWRGGVMLVLAGLVLTGLVAVWQLCIVAFAITAGEILVDPSVTALVPTVVRDEDLDSANGRIASVEIVTEEFAGGPVGAAAFAFAPWLPFVIDGLSYVASVVPFRRLPMPLVPEPSRSVKPEAPATSIRNEASEAFHWLRHHRVLGPLTIATTVYYFGAAAGFSLLVVMVTKELDGSAPVFGAILAVGAAGAFIGALLGSHLSRALGARTTLAGATLIEGAALLAMALAPSLPIAFVFWFAHELPAGTRRPVARALQQRLTPNRLLGRVNVTSRVFTRGVIIIGALTSGAIAGVAGVRWSFVLGGLVEALAAALTWRALGRDLARSKA